jgi:hypothetical protein
MWNTARLLHHCDCKEVLSDVLTHTPVTLVSFLYLRERIRNCCVAVKNFAEKWYDTTRIQVLIKLNINLVEIWLKLKARHLVPAQCVWIRISDTFICYCIISIDLNKKMYSCVQSVFLVYCSNHWAERHSGVAAPELRSRHTDVTVYSVKEMGDLMHWLILCPIILPI